MDISNSEIDAWREEDHLKERISEMQNMIDKLAEESKQLCSDLETERMRLACCGVVALADTPISAAVARTVNPIYWSASCYDVARRVDECMELRGQLKELLQAIEGYDTTAVDSPDWQRRVKRAVDNCVAGKLRSFFGAKSNFK